jgi:hypothetical protein
MSDRPNFAKPIDEFLYSPEPRITALKPFQHVGAKHMITWASTINGACTGGGKTVMTIAAIDALDLFPAVVVCGSRIALQWAGEFIHWLKLNSSLRPDLTVSILEGERPQPFEHRYIKTLAGDETISVPLNDLSADVLIATYSIVYDWANAIAERGNRVLVMDECHRVNRLRNRTRGEGYPVIGTLQAVACWYLARKVVPTYYFQHIYGLSADAVVNRPKDLCGILEILGVMWRLGGREYFIERYCGTDGKGSSNLEELHGMLTDLGLLFRVTKQQALPHMPANSEITIPLTLSNVSEYQRAEADVLTYVREMVLLDRELNARLEAMSDEELLAKSREIAARSKMLLPPESSFALLREYIRHSHALDAQYRAARSKALARIAVLRRLTGVGKVEAVIEWLSDFFEENPDEKMVVFAHHRHVQERLVEAFPNCARLLGGQSLLDSDQSKHRFQRDTHCTLIVVSEEAGGEGVNLSSGYYSMIVEWPWTAKAINQMIGRSNGRMDNPHAIVAHFCHAAGSIDDEIRKILHRKLQMSSMILDGKEAEGCLAQPIGDELLASLLAQNQ